MNQDTISQIHPVQMGNIWQCSQNAMSPQEVDCLKKLFKSQFCLLQQPIHWLCLWTPGSCQEKLT